MYDVSIAKLNAFVDSKLGGWQLKKQVEMCVTKVETDADDLGELKKNINFFNCSFIIGMIIN